MCMLTIRRVGAPQRMRLNTASWPGPKQTSSIWGTHKMVGVPVGFPLPPHKGVRLHLILVKPRPHQNLLACSFPRRSMSHGSFTSSASHGPSRRTSRASVRRTSIELIQKKRKLPQTDSQGDSQADKHSQPASQAASRTHTQTNRPPPTPTPPRTAGRRPARGAKLGAGGSEGLGHQSVA